MSRWKCRVYLQIVYFRQRCMMNSIHFQDRKNQSSFNIYFTNKVALRFGKDCLQNSFFHPEIYAKLFFFFNICFQENKKCMYTAERLITLLYICPDPLQLSYVYLGYNFSKDLENLRILQAQLSLNLGLSRGKRHFARLPVQAIWNVLVQLIIFVLSLKCHRFLSNNKLNSQCRLGRFTNLRRVSEINDSGTSDETGFVTESNTPSRKKSGRDGRDQHVQIEQNGHCHPIEWKK